ncbi:MAG: aminoacyl-tRNA hydrolase [Candidatus Pacebacteria bacterium]|nr:aminoacyl-tRNA hydrolase [Candidatus Paceibacterota bacterium]MDD4074016.1 aminoacyl-tRNA hydrolase [Candidatus Paceibacterota bacterium]
MKLIVGLGNYGSEYQKTRHNYGFMVIDAFAQRNDFPDFKPSLLSLISIKNNIILAKPQTYMNNSGSAVKAIMDYYKIKLEDILVIHDDIDIVLGKIKEDKDRGSAGHNGVKSIINSIGSKDFKRLRMGINSNFENKPLENIVLEKFTKDEEIIVSEAIEESIEIICSIIKEI